MMLRSVALDTMTSLISQSILRRRGCEIMRSRKAARRHFIRANGGRTRGDRRTDASRMASVCQRMVPNVLSLTITAPRGSEAAFNQQQYQDSRVWRESPSHRFMWANTYVVHLIICAHYLNYVSPYLVRSHPSWFPTVKKERSCVSQMLYCIVNNKVEKDPHIIGCRCMQEQPPAVFCCRNSGSITFKRFFFHPNPPPRSLNPSFTCWHIVISIPPGFYWPY